MKKACIVIVCLLLVGMFGFGNGSLPKETVQKVSDILGEAVKETQSANPDEQKVRQVKNLTYIATLYEKAGLHDHAGELISLAIQLMRATQNHPKDKKSDSMIIGALIDIARADYELGNSKEADTLLNEALSMAQAYEDELDRASQLSEVAKAYAKIGREDTCRKILPLFEETAHTTVLSERSLTNVIIMLNIAEIYNELGKKDKAWGELSRVSSWVESLDSDDMFDMLVIMGSEIFVASAYAEFGPYDKALEVAREYPRHLLELADRDREDGKSDREQARLNDVVSLAKSQENNLYKADYLYQVAAYYAKTGHPDMVGPLRAQADTALANATKQEWEDYYLAGKPHAGRALLAAHLGEYDKALELARTIPFTGHRAKAIADIASIIMEKAKQK